MPQSIRARVVPRLRRGWKPEPWAVLLEKVDRFGRIQLRQRTLFAAVAILNKTAETQHEADAKSVGKGEAPGKGRDEDPIRHVAWYYIGDILSRNASSAAEIARLREAKALAGSSGSGVEVGPAAGAVGGGFGDEESDNEVPPPLPPVLGAIPGEERPYSQAYYDAAAVLDNFLSLPPLAKGKLAGKGGKAVLAEKGKGAVGKGTGKGKSDRAPSPASVAPSPSVPAAKKPKRVPGGASLDADAEPLPPRDDDEALVVLVTSVSADLLEAIFNIEMASRSLRQLQEDKCKKAVKAVRDRDCGVCS